MIKKDNDKIKEMASNQAETMCLGQNEKFPYVDNCDAAKICPHCGSDIFVNMGDVDKAIERRSLFPSVPLVNGKIMNFQSAASETNYKNRYCRPVAVFWAVL